jgi:hypothetical protein
LNAGRPGSYEKDLGQIKENNLVLVGPLISITRSVQACSTCNILSLVWNSNISVGLTNVLRTSIQRHGETIVPPVDDAMFNFY